jgi:capsular polysaccharide biosynthesis protein
LGFRRTLGKRRLFVHLRVSTASAWLPEGSIQVGELETSTLRHYLGVLWRRRVAVLLPIALLSIIVFALSERQQPVHEATAEVLLNHQEEVATSIVGVETPLSDPNRYAYTQTIVARSPTLATRVLRAAGQTGPPKSLLDHSTVDTNGDVLEFTVRNPKADVAARLASTYAREYTQYRRRLDTRELSRTLSELENRIGALRRRSGSGALVSSLLAKAQDIRLLEALRQSNVNVLRTATAADADQVAPRPIHNTALAVGVGLLLGLIAALCAEAFDTRIRSLEELEERLEAPFLGSIRERGAPDAGDGARDDDVAAVVLRLELTRPPGETRVLMIAGLRGAAAADLAVSLASVTAGSGRPTLIVDLDFRARTVTRAFGAGDEGNDGGASAGLDTSRDTAAGIIPADRHTSIPQAMSPDRVAATLSDARRRADTVFVSVPPLLEYGDAAGVAAHVDGVILVVAPDIRRGDVATYQRATATWPQPLSGFVVMDGPRRRLSVMRSARREASADPIGSVGHPAESPR